MQAVIFDLDGVMVDTEPLYHRSFNLALARRGVTRAVNLEEYGRVFVGADAEEQWYIANLGFRRDQISALAADWSQLFDDLLEDEANLAMMPGLVPLLGELESRGVRLGVASSTARPRVETILRKLNLGARFQAVVCGTDVEKIKPAPDIYLRVLEKLCVPAPNVVAIEDSAAGIVAAKAAGLRVIAVPNQYTRHQDLSGADAQAENLGQVIGMIV